MKPFSRNKPDRITPRWQYDAGVALWRIKPDNAGHIVGEARDTSARTCSFFCIDEYNGTVLWQGLRFDEAWWIGIEDTVDGRVFLHGFGKPDMPHHLGIIACDIETGDILWREEELSFLFYHEGSVYAARQGFEALRFFQLEAATGKRLHDLGEDAVPINRLRESLNDEVWFAGYAYPEQFSAGHPAWERLPGIAATVPEPSSLAGNLDVLEHNGIRYIAWHERFNNGGVTQRFAALDTNGNLLMQETMLDYAEAPGMDSFFIKDQQLFYVRNRNVLVAYPVIGSNR